MRTVSDGLWLWGHPAGSLNPNSQVTPLDGAAYLGTKNIFYVPMGRRMDRAAETEKMAAVTGIGWSMESERQVLELIELKKRYPNITIAVFDDFFNEENVAANYTNYSIEKMQELKRRLHDVGIEMWVVVYTRLLHMDVSDYLAVFDGVSYWFWHEATEDEFEAKCQWFFTNCPEQKKLIGCYLYDFGNAKEMPPETVRYQLDRNLMFMKEGRIDGIVLHTNAVGGLGYEGYEEARRWTLEHGEERF